MNHVEGQFEVKATPLNGDIGMEELGAMRMRFDKRFSGALDATSVVSMLGLMKQETGSGAYVALEKVSGVLAGRQGTFCLQHSSSMFRGKPEQLIRVVPDSGTGELSGIAGSMTIDIVDGQHFYRLDYTVS